MPNENTVFTPSSILFRPHQQATVMRSGELMVEAPGTAPGSEWFIAQAIYRHSQQADTLNIDTNLVFSKALKGFNGIVSNLFAFRPNRRFQQAGQKG